MLLDDAVPRCDFSERHETVVAAPKEVVRRALGEWQPNESLLWRTLLRLRGLGKPAGTMRQWAESMGFICVGENGDEVVYGQAGRFWSLNERGALVSPKTPEEFRDLADARYAIAAMNVLVEALAPDRTRVYTETRVRALGPSAKRWFRLYWLLIRPFSDLLRRSMLAGIAAKAMSTARASERASKS